MRYINLCPPNQPVKDADNKYQRYIRSYQFYENTPQRKEYMKEYNQQYREQHNQHITCICGSVYKSTSFYAHIKTNKHTAYIKYCESNK